ncbi:MAG: PorV/PorQ family protein [Calditrichaeota bacterium]|nr:MAG: PorV/PorQ family protein [Calditrichota bacterium]
MIILLGMNIQGSFGQEYRKLAQTGLKFLTVPMDARASGLSGALTSLETGSIALMFNPASMSMSNHTFDVALGQVGWIADINYMFGTASFRPMQGRYGVFGLSLMSVDYGTMYNTVLAENEQGFLELGEFNPIAYSVGLGYAKALTDRFMIGGQAKYVFQSLGAGIVSFTQDEVQNAQSFDVDVFAFDFGLLYRTGYRSLNFGISVRNFSQEIKYIEESFQLPLTFRMGVSMNVLDLTQINPETHKVLMTIDASHPRDYVEQLDVGLEYIFLNSFALRAGYTSPTDEQGLSLGAGFQQSLSGFGLNLDYAFTDFGILSEVHRFTFKFNF